ncbi:MAG TPA: TonB-dependent receptor [Anaeromyxobacteraceae bacterium]|nr:TonB-dependent receptor [Anaeromyxobacteraceae bacterium]
MVAGLLCALLVGQAAVPPAEPASGVLTRAPVLRRFVEAEYPPELAAAGIAGAVGLSLVIDAAGAVERAAVTATSGQPALDAAALLAVVQFEFEPAEIDGVPAAVEIDYRYEFVLRRPAPALPAEAPLSLRGRVVERGTRSPVVGATVQAGSALAVTDGDGAFELRGLAPGTVLVRIASSDHQPFAVEEAIAAGEVREVEYRVRRRHYDPYEAVVHGERDRKEVAVHTLTQDEVRTLPGTQGDTLKVLQNLPGVARSPFGLGLLVVRGSAPQDTRVYVDGIEIPLLFHFGGITSVVASDTVGTLEFYPGNFGARYGRAMGGTVDVRSREPGRAFHGSAEIDVYDGSARAEGALGDGTWSLAARRSWVDGVLAVVLPRVAPRTASELRVAPRYYDYQAKLGYPVLGGWAELLAFGADDALEFVRPEDSLGRPTFSLRTGFHRLALRYRRPIGDAASNEATLAAGWDRFDVLQGENFGVLTTIRSLTLRDAFKVRTSEALSLELGVDALLRGFDYSIYAPPLRTPGQVGGFVGDTATQVGEAARGSWLSPAVYAEAEWRPAPRWRLVPGLRLDLDTRLARGSPWVDPRLAVSYEVARGTVLTAAAGAYGEAPAPQQTTRTFGNPDLGAQRAWEYSLGVRQDLPWSAGLEVTAFFKDLRDVVGQTRAAGPDGTPLLLSNGTVGQVWGLEMLLRRQLARGLYGWIAYTLSESSRRDDPTMPSYPAWHLFGFDQTHILTVVMSYRTGADWTIGTRIRGASGNPYTPAVGSVLLSDAGRYQCLGAARPFSARLPGFFQTDVRVDKRFVYDLWSLSAYLDVQNVTNRANAEFNFRSFDCSQQVAVAGLPVFPTLGVRAEW